MTSWVAWRASVSSPYSARPGSGKSSLVRAGLVPSLEGGFMAEAGTHWVTGIMRPQNDPVGSLTRSLVEARVLRQRSTFRKPQRRGRRDDAPTQQPGPVEAVRLARLEPHENVLILVDQFEELFRFADAVAAGRRGRGRPS